MSSLSGAGDIPRVQTQAMLPAAELPAAPWCRGCVVANKNQASSNYVISIIGFSYLVHLYTFGQHSDSPVPAN